MMMGINPLGGDDGGEDPKEETRNLLVVRFSVRLSHRFNAD